MLQASLPRVQLWCFANSIVVGEWVVVAVIAFVVEEFEIEMDPSVKLEKRKNEKGPYAKKERKGCGSGIAKRRKDN